MVNDPENIPTPRRLSEKVNAVAWAKVGTENNANETTRLTNHCL